MHFITISMKALTFWKIIGIGGIAVNAVVITLLLSRPNLAPMHKGDIKIREKMADLLEFTPSQLEKYDNLIMKDKKQLRDLQKRRRLFFKTAMLENDLKKRHAAIDSLASIAHKLEYGRIQHFYNIQAICNSEQKELFDDKKDEIFSWFQPISRPNKKSEGLKERPKHGPPHFRDDNMDMPPPPPPMD